VARFPLGVSYNKGMSRSVTCRISGKSFVFATEYFKKRVEEYTDVESLQKYYVTKKVKSLIVRGYSAQEIRNILIVEEDNLIDVDSQEIIDIMIYHGLRNETISKKNSSNFATHKSDPDVSAFINNIKDLNYDQEIYSANRQ
jgi:hypothetical protein